MGEQIDQLPIKALTTEGTPDSCPKDFRGRECSSLMLSSPLSYEILPAHKLTC